MQGFIFCEFQEYIERSFGFDAWLQVSEKAQVTGKDYSRFQCYPIAELERLAVALSNLTNKPHKKLLEDFGTHLASPLWNVCKRMIPSKWGLLDLLQNLRFFTSHLLAHAVTGTDVESKIECERISHEEVAIRHTSTGRMDSLARGIVKGLGKHYNSQVTISEPRCLLRGDPACEIIFRIKSL